MTLNSFSAFTLSRAAVATTLLAGVVGCAPRASESPSAAVQGTPSQTASTSVLLSCPAGQQPLLRQVVVHGAAVPQIECVSAAPAGLTSAPGMPVAAVPVAQPAAAPPTPLYATAPAPTYAAAPVAYQAAAPVALRPRTVARPAARRVVYEDDVVEYRRPSKRSWGKSALIIGGAAGAGAGVGAATGGKKGALIGAAVGGGAATLWDQITRRQPR